MLAGARYGTSGIPQRWLRALDPLVREQCENQAHNLMNAVQNTDTPFQVIR